MPYHIGKSSQCPASKPIAVIKDSDGKVMGCHPNKDKAKAQLAALYANEPSAEKHASPRKHASPDEIKERLRILDDAYSVQRKTR